MLLVILKSKDIVWAFYKKTTCKKQIKKSLELKKYSKEKAINYMSNGKTRIILLTVQLIKMTLLVNIFKNQNCYKEE